MKENGQVEVWAIFFHYFAHIQASCIGSNVCWQYLGNAVLYIYNLRLPSEDFQQIWPPTDFQGGFADCFSKVQIECFVSSWMKNWKNLEMGEIHTLHAVAVNVQLCLHSHPWCFTGMPSMKEEFIFIFLSRSVPYSYPPHSSSSSSKTLFR